MTRRLLPAVVLLFSAAPAVAQDSSWRDDPAWHRGKAEWALYEATRTIYGVAREYEATIFTNKQHQDPGTTTKATDWREEGSVEVFKHNVSEMIPTENYTYRFLTTCFVRTDSLATYKVVASSQEDCGSSYKQFVADDERINVLSVCYFPGTGVKEFTYAAPASAGIAFHDALTLTLRDYPFDGDDKDKADREIHLVADQTDTREPPHVPSRATVDYVGAETISVPYGTVPTHHLRVTHEAQGGTETSDYWFAADATDMRHVLVRYEGPYGVTYRLKALDWWAYWDRSAPRPRRR